MDGVPGDSIVRLPAQAVCDYLWEEVQTFGQGQPQQDDFTAVVIKRLT